MASSAKTKQDIVVMAVKAKREGSYRLVAKVGENWFNLSAKQLCELLKSQGTEDAQLYLNEFNGDKEGFVLNPYTNGPKSQAEFEQVVKNL